MTNKKTKKESADVVEVVDTIETIEQKETRETTLIEKYGLQKDQTIAIRPYFNSDVENMGLENYGMTLFENVWHTEELSCLEINGVKRYITGLNEFSPEIKKLSPEERKIRVRQVRGAVAQLEAELASNIIDPEAPDFWNQVQLLRPDHDKLWGKIQIKLGNDPVYLDPKTDPYDLIKIFAIESGGFDMIAKSLNDAKQNGKKKFYLDKFEETVNTRTSTSKLRNRALASLQSLYDSNPTKLLYVAKVVDPDSTKYLRTTPNDVMYENMDLFIYGEGTESSKEKAAKTFLTISRMELGELKIMSVIKDAKFFNYLTAKNGYIVDAITGSRLGKTNEEVYSFLINPINEDILQNLLDKVEIYWNK